MRHELKELAAQLGITSVFVTHDQTEAMSMSDRIAVLREGCVEQFDTPETIYHHPATPFVARFVGKSDWLSETTLFRPEAASETAVPGAVRYDLPVSSVQYLGDAYEVIVPYQGHPWTLRCTRRIAPGERLSVYIDPRKIITCEKKEA